MKAPGILVVMDRSSAATDDASGPGQEERQLPVTHVGRERRLFLGGVAAVLGLALLVPGILDYGSGPFGQGALVTGAAVTAAGALICSRSFGASRLGVTLAAAPSGLFLVVVAFVTGDLLFPLNDALEVLLDAVMALGLLWAAVGSTLVYRGMKYRFALAMASDTATSSAGAMSRFERYQLLLGALGLLITLVVGILGAILK